MIHPYLKKLTITFELGIRVGNPVDFAADLATLAGKGGHVGTDYDGFVSVPARTQIILAVALVLTPIQQVSTVTKDIRPPNDRAGALGQAGDLWRGDCVLVILQTSFQVQGLRQFSAKKNRSFYRIFWQKCREI